MKCEEFNKDRNKYRKEKLVELKELVKTKDEVITLFLSCIEDLANAITDKKLKNTQIHIKESLNVSHTDFHPQTVNAKITNSKLNTTK